MILLALLFAVAVLAWGWPVVIGGALVAAAAFRAGQYHRGYAHARGIRRSHWAQIQGRGH